MSIHTRNAPGISTLILGLLLFSAPASADSSRPSTRTFAAPDLWYPPLPSGAVQPPPLQIKIQVGFDSKGQQNPSGDWCPVTVRLRNNTDLAVEGTVQISTQDLRGDAGGSSLRTQTMLTASADTVLRTVVFLGADDSRIQVVFRPDSDGRLSPLTSYAPTLAIPQPNQLWLILRDSPTTVPEEDEFVCGRSGESQLRPIGGGCTLFARPSPDELPEQWIGYSAAYAVVLAEPELVHRLSDVQWDALVAFVRSGGRLLVQVKTRQGLEALRSPRLRVLLPDRAYISSASNSPFLMTGRGNLAGALGPGADLLRQFEEATTYPVSTSVTSDRIDPTQDAWQRFGLGGVVLLGGLPLARGDGQSPPSIRPAACQILMSAQPLGVPPLASPFRGGSAFASSASVDQAFRSEEVARIPSRGSLLFFLLAYCLILGPISRLIFNRLGRPLLTWTALPILVALAIVVAQQQMSLRWPDEPLLKEISLIQSGSGDAQGLVTSYLSLFSPWRSIYSVEMSAPEVAVRHLVDQGQRGLEREVLQFVNGGVSRPGGGRAGPHSWDENGLSRVEGLLMASRSRLTLQSNRLLPLGRGLSVTVTERSDQEIKRAELRNDTGLPLKGAYLFNPKERYAYEFAFSREGTPDVPNLRRRDALTADHLARAVTDSQGKDATVLASILREFEWWKTRPYLVAWSHQSVSGLTIVPDGTGGTAADKIRAAAVTVFVVDAVDRSRP